MAATPSVSPAPWSHAISKDDHGPLVSIATSLMLAGMVLLLVIRLAIRWPWRQLIGLDDAMTVVGSLFALGQSIAIYRALSYGFGQREEDTQPERFEDMEKALYASDILFVVSLLASKMAVAMLLFRLSSARKMILAAYGIMGFIGTWGFASILAVAIRPNLSSPWILGQQDLLHVMNVWTGVGALSVLTEIALVVFPIFLVWTLQMPISSKLTVIAAFSFRIPVAVLSIIRIVAFHSTLHASSANISWHHVTLTIYTELEMHISLIAATIPCMHVFLKNFNTGYLGTTADQVDITATMAATKGSSSYVMSTVRSRHTQASEEERKKELKLRPDGAGVSTSRVVHRERGGDGGTDAGSMTSDGSDKIMVRKTVQVNWDASVSGDR